MSPQGIVNILLDWSGHGFWYSTRLSRFYIHSTQDTRNFFKYSPILAVTKIWTFTAAASSSSSLFSPSRSIKRKRSRRLIRLVNVCCCYCYWYRLSSYFILGIHIFFSSSVSHSLVFSSVRTFFFTFFFFVFCFLLVRFIFLSRLVSETAVRISVVCDSIPITERHKQHFCTSN